MVQSRQQLSQVKGNIPSGHEATTSGLNPDLAAYFVSTRTSRRPILSLRLSGVLGELAEGMGRD